MDSVDWISHRPWQRSSGVSHGGAVGLYVDSADETWFGPRSSKYFGRVQPFHVIADEYCSMIGSDFGANEALISAAMQQSCRPAEFIRLRRHLCLHRPYSSQ
jgi:hypothetical protein